VPPAVTAPPGRRPSRPVAPPDSRRSAAGRGQSALALAILVLVVALWVGDAVGAALGLVGSLSSRPPITAEVDPQTPRIDPVLQTRVAAATSLSRGVAGAVVRSLDDGAEAEVDADRPFPAASLFKLPILVETLRQQREGRLTPDTLLEVTPDTWADGAGVLQARLGDRLPVRELLTLMVRDSDNIAALVLLDAVDVDQVNATMAQMGLTQTRLRDHRGGDVAPHSTSARDMATLLALMASGRLFDPETSETALQLLELRQANTWLADDLPFWVRVAHKWGDLPEARHDAGIVFTPRGSYVSVVLTQGGAPDETRRAIAAVSRAGFDRAVTGR